MLDRLGFSIGIGSAHRVVNSEVARTFITHYPGDKYLGRTSSALSSQVEQACPRKSQRGTKPGAPQSGLVWLTV